MILFPYENFYLFTRLTHDAVQAKLQEVVSPDIGYDVSWRGMFPAGPNTRFKGYVKKDGFKFKPTIIYCNAFIPQINGEVEVFEEWTRIHIKMKLRTFAVIFTVCLGFLGIAGIAQIPQLSGRNDWGGSESSLFLFLFVYVLATASFKSESRSARFFLIELLEAE